MAGDAPTREEAVLGKLLALEPADKREFVSNVQELLAAAGHPREAKVLAELSPPVTPV